MLNKIDNLDIRFEKEDNMIKIGNEKREYKIVAGNDVDGVIKFKYEGKTYYAHKYRDWTSIELFVFNYLYDEKDHPVVLWNDLREIFEDLVKKYKIFEREDDFIKSAPDTSKFIATKKGDIEVLTDYVKSGGTYGINRYFPVLLKIGSNFPYDALTQNFWDKVYSELLNALLSGVKINNRNPFIYHFNGSAFSGIGLAI